MHLKSINRKNLSTSLKFLAVMPLALLNRFWQKNVWIITERPDQARDNGYCFFKYVREHYPDQRIIYIIDKSAADYRKIRQYRTVVQFDSWSHFYYYCLSKVHISSHVGGCIPADSPIARRLKDLLSVKDVFLPHGVSYGVAEFCLQKYARIDLFICSGYAEYENVLRNYGYTKKQVAYTGFPRLDLWHDIHINKKQILVMPTWRLYISQNPNTIFTETVYYKTYQSLINNRKLTCFLEKAGLELVFYLHHEMQKYVHYFSTKCSNIRIVQPGEDCDIQELLKSAALLVTDYSSVHFDFAYMHKPVLYFQFDKKTFFQKQYSESGFVFERDGFGPVLLKEDDLVDAIIKYKECGYHVDEFYSNRMKMFYRIYDRNNCERVYQEVKARFV